MAQEQDKTEELTFSDNQDGDVELIEAPRVDQSSFMTPPKGNQGMTTTPSIPPYLSNSVSKKHILQLVSISIKDVVTKYADYSSKRRK